MTQTEKDNFCNEKCQYYGAEGHIAKICQGIPNKSSINEEIQHALAALTTDNTLAETEWTTDTSASNNMTGQLGMLTNLRKYKGANFVIIGNGSSIPILGIGDTQIKQQKIALPL